jgi:hypothetical protein
MVVPDREQSISKGSTLEPTDQDGGLSTSSPATFRTPPPKARTAARLARQSAAVE